MATAPSSPYGQFVLFGDSIMEMASWQQQGFNLALALQHAYTMRLDVVNRGFSGYNTEMGLRVLPRVLPRPEHAKITFLAVLFGTNDACIPEEQNGQHVPVEKYKENLAKILTHPVVEAHQPRLILVSPPPLEERRLERNLKSIGYPALNRFNVVTKAYADAARQVAGDLKVGFLDLWTALVSRAGWKPGDALPGSLEAPESEDIKRFVHDGVHLTPDAYQIFHEELMKVIAENWPDQMPERLPRVMPSWHDSKAWAKEDSNILPH